MCFSKRARSASAAMPSRREGGKSRWVGRVANSDRTGAQCLECLC